MKRSLARFSPAALSLLSALAPAFAAGPEERADLYVVVNREARAGTAGDAERRVLEACTWLAGRDDRLLRAGSSYRRELGVPLEVDGYPSAEATGKARWLRRWLSAIVPAGGSIVLVGDEKALPRWDVKLGRLRLTTDALYGDLDGDGVPDTAVSRVIGSPGARLRQLTARGKAGRRSLIYCSEDTRIHLETRAFANALSRLGHVVRIAGQRDDSALVASDIIVHFGHGSPERIANRFAEVFVTASDLPPLPRSPIVFADGCGTLPVGSPLVRAFLERGALAYCGATATVQGMIPARYTNELVEHFLDVLQSHPSATLPHLLWRARARYVKGHPGLAERLRELAREGAVAVAGEEAAHLLAVTEWVVYGSPRATLAGVGPPTSPGRRLAGLKRPVRLTPGAPSWRATFETGSGDGLAVLALYAEIPIGERDRFRLAVLLDGEARAGLDSRRDTVYQRLGADCRGGYRCRDLYRARALLPLSDGEPGAPGRRTVEVRLARGTSAVLAPGTEVTLWPRDFPERIGLRHVPASRPASRSGPPSAPGQPVPVTAKVKTIPAGAPGYRAVDLSAGCNRPHDSLRVGGGDNASFKTWFPKPRVRSKGVPFVVRRSGLDVLVSPDNTENVFTLEGLDESAVSIHCLLWGYNRPRRGARWRITFADGSAQESTLPIVEWTEAHPSFAFDFQNTVRGFGHAGITHAVVRIADPDKRIRRIASLHGTYGLAAVTLDRAKR